MAAQHTEAGRANALKGELRVHVEEPSAAPPAAVYELLANVRNHLEWAGDRQPKDNYRLLSIEAPEGRAIVGTEFSSTGADPMGRFADSSVVTEATAPSLFEFVTEANQTLKKGTVVVWTSVHRYEITPQERGSRIAYTIRTVRISRLPGMLAVFNVPGLRSLLLKFAGSNARRGVRNLARLAEERAGVSPAAGRRDG